MDKKTCPRCGKSLQLSMFSSHNVRGTQVWCKKCRSAYDKKHYLENSKRIKERNKLGKAKRKEINRNNIVQHLNSHPCVDCGEMDITILTFDHIKGKKKFTISNAVSTGMLWTRIELELSKCEVRCFNCHMRRTAKEGGWTKYKAQQKKTK